jgi:hypothetical protein
MSLQDWLKSRWLIKHQTSRQEILDLLSMADRDLTQCQTPHLSPDWQLNIAYHAACKRQRRLWAPLVIGHRGRLIITG